MWAEKSTIEPDRKSTWMEIIFRCFCTRSSGILKQATMSRKPSGHFCSYMVRNCKGIEMLVNLINICYCAMKILPYQDEQFSEYRTKSVQEFRFELSQGIRSQIFLTNFVRNIETHIKLNVIIKALKTC